MGGAQVKGMGVWGGRRRVGVVGGAQAEGVEGMEGIRVSLSRCGSRMVEKGRFSVLKTVFSFQNYRYRKIFSKNLYFLLAISTDVEYSWQS